MFVLLLFLVRSKQREKNLPVPLNVSRNIGPTNKNAGYRALQSEQFQKYFSNFIVSIVDRKYFWL